MRDNECDPRLAVTLAPIAAAVASIAPFAGVLADPQASNARPAEAAVALEEPDADGAAAPAAVVLESTSAAHRVGDAAAVGAVFVLAAGERVVLLDRAGVVTTFESPGRHTLLLESEGDRGSPARDAVNALFDSRQRPEVGGTRDRDRAACLDRAARDAALDPADCDLAAEEARPGLALALAGGEAAQAGARVRFVMTAAFDAYVTCAIAPQDDPAAAAVLTLGRRPIAGAAAARLAAGVTAHAPMRGAVGALLPERAGNYVVTCAALDARAAETLAQAAADAAPLSALEGARLRHAYAAVHGAPYAEAELRLRVIAP